MAFDITSVLKDVSGPVNGMEQIEYIHLDQIDPDPNNFYSLKGINELADNIATIGLQQPLRVRPGSESGRFTIVSGHRRRAACMMIRDGEDDCRTMFDQGVPCIVERGEASIALQELRLIYANAATRVMTAAEISKQAERVEALLYQLKEEGMEFPGRMRDHVAKACQVSKTKIARLHAIRNNLDPGLLEYFDKGQINEAEAYELQKVPAEGQRAIAASVKRTGDAYFISIANAEVCAKRAKKFMDPMTCPDGGDCDHHETRFVQVLRSDYSYKRCIGECCLKCSERDDCRHACSKAKVIQKKDKDKRKAKREKDEAEQKAKEEKIQKERRMVREKSAQRVLPLIEAAGMKDEDRLPCGRYCNSIKVSEIRKAAAGDHGTQYFYSDSSLIPIDAGALIEWADLLDCSIDFLVGRADTPKPAKVSGSDTGWQTGDPTELGEYVVRIGVPTTESHGSTMTAIQTWSGENWTDSRGVPLRLNVYRWVKLPEV